MSTPAGWPRSILPRDRDGRFNRLLDGVCDLYRALTPGDVITGLSVMVLDGGGRAVMLVRDGAGVRRVTVTDEVTAWPVLIPGAAA